MNHCLIAQIQGCVQGVAFRYYTQLEAERLGIRGWVKNCPDGSVKTCLCGSDEQLQSMKQWLQHGPTHARVDSVTFSAAESAENYIDFRIHH